MKRVPKSQFKPRAFEYLRMVEEAEEPIVVTDHGRDSVRLEPVAGDDVDSSDALSGAIIAWERPVDPVDEDIWEAEH